ncbi:MAG: spore protease YyaC [Desulfotomaculum sp.]|nr:spore protease YyaC [Desulfotomaculum sp.]
MAMINQLNQPSKPSKTRINSDDPLAVKKFSWDLTYKLLKCGLTPERPVVLVCIGTDRSTGDCLGPLVGSKLSEVNQDFFEVHGTLEDPVHGSNLDEKLGEIYKCYRNPLIIAIDASLGQLDSVGCINIANGSLKPGAGVHKKLPEVGDLHITGIVNVGGFMEYMILQNTRLNIVMKMAELIVEGLLATIIEYKNTKAQEI